MFDEMTAVGYRVEIEGVEADFPTCLDREDGRTKDNVSAFYAEQYQMKWLLAAASMRK